MQIDFSEDKMTNLHRRARLPAAAAWAGRGVAGLAGAWGVAGRERLGAEIPIRMGNAIGLRYFLLLPLLLLLLRRASYILCRSD